MYAVGLGSWPALTKLACEGNMTQSEQNGLRTLMMEHPPSPGLEHDPLNSVNGH